MAGSQDPIVEATDRDEQFYMLLGFWLGAVVYGLYTCIFGMFIRITLKTRRPKPTFSAKVFTYATIVMFVLTTVYMGFNTSRFLYAFGVDWLKASGGQLPVYYLHDYTKFKNFVPITIMGVLIWIGDILVIYRCLIIWQMNGWIILLPVLLFTLSVANSSVVEAWLKRPDLLTPAQALSLIRIVFPVNIAQSCITTGLITLKIWSQYLQSRAAGLNTHGSGVGLLTIIRIIVESTMIFTIQQVILIVLYYSNSAAQYVVHGTLVPSMGVIFVLLSLRVHEAKKSPKFSTFELPHPLSTAQSSPWTTSNGTGEANPGRPRRNHRRTLSDSLVFASSRFVAAERDEVDLERGELECIKSTATNNAILLVKASPPTVG